MSAGLIHTSNTTVASSHNAKAGPSSSQRLEHGVRKRGNLVLRFNLWLNLRFGLNLDLGLNLGLNGGLNLDLGLRLRGDGLGGALHELAVDSRALDQPVILAVAGDALVDAGLAEVEISVVAGGAVVVNIGDGQLAAVAADGKGSASSRADGGSLISGEGTRLRDRERGLGCVPASSVRASRLSLSLHIVGKSSLEVCAGVAMLSDVSSGIVEQSRVVGARKRVDADRECRLRRCGGRDRSWGGSLSSGSGNGADFLLLALLSGVLGRNFSHLGGDGGCESLGLVLDGNGPGDSLGQVLDRDANLELRLGLGSAVKLLINGDVAGLKEDIGCCRVRVSLKGNLEVGRNVEEGSKLAES